MYQRFYDCHRKNLLISFQNFTSDYLSPSIAYFFLYSHSYIVYAPTMTDIMIFMCYFIPQAFFLSINCLCYFCLAGNFAMMPAAIQRMFGSRNGPLIYGLIYSAFGTAALVTMFVSKLRYSYNVTRFNKKSTHIRTEARTLETNIVRVS